MVVIVHMCGCCASFAGSYRAERSPAYKTAPQWVAKVAHDQQQPAIKLRYYGGPKSPMYP